jgi:hypothetical protein
MESEYGWLDRLLHRVVLGPGFLGEALFDLERTLHSSAAPARIERPVFVTGLARAGTTALMRALHGSGEFASLTYADMPMVLAPNLWARLSAAGRRRRARGAVERAHGDGILVDVDSPEALDEVFWRVHCGADYIRPDCLVPHVPSAELIGRYRDLQRLVCLRYGRARYLSKNNNGLLRLGALADAMPEATFLVPFRAPLAHAQSLLAQHRRFARGAGFQRDYMGWLAHHEFGATHRPFRFPGGPAPDGSPETLDYWLNAWIAAYRHVLGTLAPERPRILPVSYERLCSGELGDAVCAAVGLPPGAVALAAPGSRRDAPCEPSRLAEAEDIYATLDRISDGRLVRRQ